MLAGERHKKILAILEENTFVKSAELIKLFGVSVETVRRDLEFLESEGELKRVHGGAVKDKIDAKATTLSTRERLHNAEKVEIAQKALSFISEESVIALDNGTTTLEIARLLTDHFTRLTVLTNSLSVVEALAEADDYTVILLGGIVDGRDKSMKGPLVEEYINRFYIDTAFISVTGISLIEGATDFQMEAIPVQQKMIDRSRQTILLADSSKFGVASMMKVCELKAADAIVTDDKLKDAVVERYSELNINVIR